MNRQDLALFMAARAPVVTGSRARLGFSFANLRPYSRSASQGRGRERITTAVVALASLTPGWPSWFSVSWWAGYSASQGKGLGAVEARAARIPSIG